MYFLTYDHSTIQVHVMVAVHCPQNHRRMSCDLSEVLDILMVL